MPTIRTYSASECLAAIEALEAERTTLRGVPQSGSVGSTSMNLGANRQQIEADLTVWRARLAAANNLYRPGLATRTRWEG